LYHINASNSCAHGSVRINSIRLAAHARAQIFHSILAIDCSRLSFIPKYRDWPLGGPVEYFIGYEVEWARLGAYCAWGQCDNARSLLCIAFRWQARKLKLSVHQLGLHPMAFRSRCLEHSSLHKAKVESSKPQATWPARGSQIGNGSDTKACRGCTGPTRARHRGEWPETTACSATGCIERTHPEVVWLLLERGTHESA